MASNGIVDAGHSVAPPRRLKAGLSEQRTTTYVYDLQNRLVQQIGDTVRVVQSNLSDADMVDQINLAGVHEIAGHIVRDQGHGDAVTL